MAKPNGKVDKRNKTLVILPEKRGDVGLDRNGSAGAGGSGEKERVVLEKKLKKWRSEIPEAVEVKEKEVGKEEGSSGKQRRLRRLSCFSVSGKYANEMEEDGERSSAGSRNSSSRRRRR